MKFAFCGRNGVGKTFLAESMGSITQISKNFTLDSILEILGAEDKKYDAIELFACKPFKDVKTTVWLPNTMEFALYVKILACVLSGLPFHYFDGSERELRETHEASIGKSPRKLLEEIGTWGRRIHPDFWVRAAFKHSSGGHISDLRYENEAIAAKNAGYLVICVYSSTLKAKKLKSDEKTHDSVWAFTQFPHLYDGLICNESHRYEFNAVLLKSLVNLRMYYKPASDYAWTTHEAELFVLPRNYLGKPLSAVRINLFLDEVEASFAAFPDILQKKLLKRAEKMKIFRNFFLIMDEKKYALAELCFVICASSINFYIDLSDILNFER